ncbi:hypothetical protein APHCRT_1476 [Anaplasma phagocytophilum str. CRT53-1]|uniref:Uncharacterized protein n=1 Tax=Anaplasma phagocytophilum str. CRT53-1 TaxID=1359157 RepID=A0A0F3PKD7_ANAPH|nr:hypothetical protein APHCRT_1476 [Anaplasma phagocytophilum str. CRT53-1]
MLETSITPLQAHLYRTRSMYFIEIDFILVLLINGMSIRNDIL